jgi:hypothetical protein
VTLIAVAISVCASGHPSPATRADGGGEGSPSAVAVVVGRSPLGPAIPRGFLGLSFEAAALHDGIFTPRHGRLVALLTALGPGVLRFGGETVDEAAWAPAGSYPGARFVITPPDLARMFAFARRAGWRVILGLNLGHFDPRAAADEASRAAPVAGGALAAVEFGNEPDLYTSSFTGPLRPPSYTVDQYLREWRAYFRAVRSRVPGVSVIGPSIAGVAGGLDILRRLAGAERRELAFVTSHHYPLGAPVTDPASPAYPSVAHLLSSSLRAREAEELGGWARVAEDAGLSLRLTETNSVFGGGKRGVSDTLAGALWTVDYAFRVAQLGIIGINLHAILDHCGGYSPICAPTLAQARADRFRTQPNYSALLLLRRALQGRIIPVRVVPEGSAVAYATQDSRGILRVTMIASSPRPVRVHLRLLGRAEAQGRLLSLRGPSLGATTGVVFEDLSAEPDGGGSPGARVLVRVAGGGADLEIPGASAAVVVFPP